jgi:hypothetical protein
VGKLSDFILNILPLEDRRDVMHFFLWVIVLFTIGSIHGLMPVHPGFAYSNDVATTNNNIKKIEQRLLEKELFENRMNQCKADTERSKSFYREKLQELLREYYDMTGRGYDLPSCEELGL